MIEIEQVHKNIETLGTLSTQDLKDLFQKLFPRKNIPKVKHVILSDIAYHIQSQKYGGMLRETQDILSSYKRFLHKKVCPKTSSSKKSPEPKIRISHKLRDGTVLKRKFNGRTYEVLVRVEKEERFFVFQNKSYKSLSKIAEVITGAHWSGPRFFGLTKLKVKGSNAKDSSS